MEVDNIKSLKNVIYWFLKLNSYPKTECKCYKKTEKAYKIFAASHTYLLIISSNIAETAKHQQELAGKKVWKFSVKLFCVPKISFS